MRLCAQWQAEEGPPEGTPGIAAEHLVGRKLVGMLFRSRRGHKVDALARVGGSNSWNPAAVGIKYNQEVSCTSGKSGALPGGFC